MDIIDQIILERKKQIVKYKKTPEYDSIHNKELQLSDAAAKLCLEDIDQNKGLATELCPKDWDKAWWWKMCRKTYKQRIVKAIALLIAELDRMEYTENNSLQVVKDERR